MAQLLGYMCSDDSLTRYALGEVAREAWSEASNHPVTVGFGWVQDSRSLLRKRPTRGGDPVDVLGLMADLPARCMVGHLDEQTNGEGDTLDLQPFRFRKWVYAQSAHVPDLEAYRDELIGELPDYIRRNIAGQTDAEVVFHRLYDSMHRNDALDGPRPDGARVASAAARTLNDFERRSNLAGHEGPIAVNLVAATERLIVAARMGEPIHFKTYRGIEAPEEAPLFAGHRPKTIDYPHFKGVFVANHLEPGADGWTELPDRHVMWVDGEWAPQTASFEEAIDGAFAVGD